MSESTSKLFFQDKPKFLKPSSTSSLSSLDRSETRLFGGEEATTNFVYNRYMSQSIQSQRQKLPIFDNRNHILYLLEKYQTVVLVGETGCGKSTQVPQVVLFEVRTFLDDLDGHVARVRKHVKGERSEVGTSGYYVDGMCDLLGMCALLVGAFVYLKNNPPRRGYVQLPTHDSGTGGLIYKTKITSMTYMVEADWPGQIGVCEPRRAAAISLANRVAEETGTLVQHDMVGYSVRFDTCQTKPRIKYMTEGILLREMMSDPLLKAYSAIMLDEVHERSLYTDILMGLLRKIIRRRLELRLIVASATMDAKEIFNFFNHSSTNNTTAVRKDTATILSVKGRQFPVHIYYTMEPVACYVQKAVEVAVKISSSGEGGDILIFLTGQEEVDRAVKLLNEHSNVATSKSKQMFVVPMYGSLPYRDQLRAFQRAPDDYRKVVVATNVAETSITIPGIVHVIDCGFVKMRWFNHETHTDSLITLPVSKASADQRAGRAGRVRSGKVYRLYTEDFATSKLADQAPPEITRSQLTTVVLQLKALGIANILKFKFPSPPPIDNLRSALEILYAAGAIDLNGDLTRPLGIHMAELAPPLDPLLVRVLLGSTDFGCSDEILTVVAMLQVETIFTCSSGPGQKHRSGNAILEARRRRRLFETEEGDLITYLNIYSAFVDSGMSRKFCRQNYFNFDSMTRVVEVRSRLEGMLRQHNVSLFPESGGINSNSTEEAIRRCLVSGLFPNAAYLHHSGVYKTVRGDVELAVHPDSVFYAIPHRPAWVLFCGVIHTSQLYMRDLTAIESDWLLELAPHFYQKSTLVDRD